MAKRRKHTPPPSAPADPENLIGVEEVLGPLQVLYIADPDKDAQAAAKVRRQLCPLCRETAGQPESDRAALCLAHACGLCDPDVYRLERLVLLTLLYDVREPNRASPEAVEMFNRHLSAHRSVLAILGTMRPGLRGMGFERTTLRQVIHVAALLWVTWLAGDRLHLNINADTTEGLQRTVAELRAAARGEHVARLKQEAIDLHARGHSINAIAALTERDRKDVRDWLREAGVLDPRE